MKEGPGVPKNSRPRDPGSKPKQGLRSRCSGLAETLPQSISGASTRRFRGRSWLRSLAQRSAPVNEVRLARAVPTERAKTSIEAPWRRSSLPPEMLLRRPKTPVFLGRHRGRLVSLRSSVPRAAGAARSVPRRQLADGVGLAWVGSQWTPIACGVRCGTSTRGMPDPPHQARKEVTSSEPNSVSNRTGMVTSPLPA